ncbi:hypothetical protein [Microbispora sp. CA-102843]|uniref:hypothetical protein n=1 Tax=Microbispora sp. CA-102843 TaxID=3239952 RepID=UPI003D8CCD2B
MKSDGRVQRTEMQAPQYFPVRAAQHQIVHPIKAGQQARIARVVDAAEPDVGMEYPTFRDPTGPQIRYFHLAESHGATMTRFPAKGKSRHTAPHFFMLRFRPNRIIAK